MLQRNTLFVRNYPQAFTEDNLRQLFSMYGEVTNVRVFRDRFEHATIEFASHMDATNAKKMTENEIIGGRNLHVKFYESKFLRKQLVEERVDRLNFDRYKKQREYQQNARNMA